MIYSFFINSNLKRLGNISEKTLLVSNARTWSLKYDENIFKTIIYLKENKFINLLLFYLFYFWIKTETFNVNLVLFLLPNV